MAGRKSFLYFGGTNRVNPTSSETRFDFDESEIWNVVVESDQGKKMPWLLKTQTVPTKNRGSKLVAENDHRRSSSSSLPLKIPDWSGIFNGDDDDDEYGRLPPHEYLARRKGSSFSVHEGIGRTLKGRDMSRVRNAVWKQTGFED